MDPNTAMEVATEGAKALTKFQEIIQKVFGPRWTKKQADAEAYADERKLQTIRDNPDMEISYVAGEMFAREKTPEALARRAECRMLSEAIRQEENIENIIDIAANEVQQATTLSDKSVDDDWIARLFNIIKDINSEEMQYVWGKILAGEIIAPGSFSFRTLETVRNISKEDADTFQKIMPLVTNCRSYLSITSNDEILNKYGVSYDDILLLDECGLINSSGTLALHPSLRDNMEIYFYTNKRIIIIKSNNSTEKKLTIGIHSLTKTGVELFNILGHDSNDSYILDLASEIRSKNKKADLEISVHQVTGILGETINYHSQPIKVFDKES